MMKLFKFNTATKAVLGAGLLSLALVGCDDGENGEDGKSTPVGSQIGEVSQVKTEITSASVSDSGYLTVNFDLIDANGASVFGLKNADIGAVSFGRMGNEDEVGTTDIEDSPREIWLSYFNKDKGEGHYTGSAYFQGKNCEDCLTDNGDGSYTLVLNDYPINTLDKYAFDAEATNGLYLGVKAKNDAGTALVNNSFYYWQPSSDTAQEQPKAMIADETCQSCHRPGQDGELALHGGKHITLESCTFCHTDYNIYEKENKDASGVGLNTFYQFDGSIKGLAHDIHSNSFYQEEIKDGDGKVIQAKGIYPQIASNCITCHKPDETQAMADAWKADLDTATCINCHNSSSTAPSWHRDADNEQFIEKYENCVYCHNSDGRRGAERGHYSENAKAQAIETKITFNSMFYDKDEQTIKVNMSVMQNGTAVTLDQIDTTLSWGKSKSGISFNGVVDDDYLVNYQKIGREHFIPATDGTFDITFDNSMVKFDTVVNTPNVNVVLRSNLNICFDGKGKVEDCKLDADGNVSNAGPYAVSKSFYFNLDNNSQLDASPRVQHAVMTEACQQCHTPAIKHYYSDDIDGCATCHNGTRDKSMKNYDGTTARYKGSSNLAHIVHSKHYLRDSSGDMFYKKTDCQSCHAETGFSLSLIKADAAPVAFGKVDDTPNDANPTWGEQLVVSPQTAACISCHQGGYAIDEAAASHMESMGGILREDGAPLTTFGIPLTEYQDLNVQETCSTCHNDSQLLEVHSNWR